MTSFFLRKVSVLLLMLVMIMWSFVFSIETTFAQPSANNSNFQGVEFCPIEVGIIAQFVNLNTDLLRIEDAFSAEASISNNSTFVMSGIKVGIGAYASADQNDVSLFWSVLPGEYQLLPGETITVPIELDVSALPAGEHTLKIKAIQGDESAVLGTLLQNSVETDEFINITKINTQNKQTTSTVTINDVPLSSTAEFSGGISTIKISTKNNSRTPLVNSQILAVISEGSIPLGTAIVSEKQQPITLIPGASQSTILRNIILRGGEYTISSALITEGVLQPVTREILSLPGNSASSWEFLSKIGVTDFPLRENSTVVACLGTINEVPEEVPYRFSGLFGFSFLTQTTDGVSREGIVYTDEVSGYDYVTFVPGIASTDFSITTTLLQQSYSIEFNEEEVLGLEEYNKLVKESLFEASSVIQKFVCLEESCELDESNELLFDKMDDTQSQSFWFYFGIVLAATLLMLLVLRRLPPEDTIPMEQKLSNKESQ